MKLIERSGIPTDICSDNLAISESKLILKNGLLCRGYYSYVTAKWIIIEEFKQPIFGFKNKTEVIWFEVDNSSEIKNICNHDWDEGFHGVSKCKKCNKYSA